MPETPLDYDKIIWEVFAVGVVSSVVILYYTITKSLNGYELWALIFGFAILIYSFKLILGYGFKKKSLIIERPEVRINGLSRHAYPRVRFIGELIMLSLMGFYLFIFTKLFHFIGFLIAVLILILFVIIGAFSNILARLEFERRNLGNQNWQKFWRYIKDYFE